MAGPAAQHTTRNAIVAFVAAGVLSIVALGLLAWGREHRRDDLRFRPAAGAEWRGGRDVPRPPGAGPRAFPHGDGVLPNGKPFPGRGPQARPDRRPDPKRGGVDDDDRPNAPTPTSSTTTTTAPAGG
jgi:hypothetical protein